MLAEDVTEYQQPTLAALVSQVTGAVPAEFNSPPTSAPLARSTAVLRGEAHNSATLVHSNPSKLGN